jgi:GT2 family glycosyltransferase
VPAVAVIVVNFNRADLLGECLRSVSAAGREVEEPPAVVVVDNASADGSAEMVEREFPAAELVRMSRNAGFAGGVAEGLRRTRTPWVLLLNNDATLEPGALAPLLAAARSAPDVGMVAAQMRFADAPELINSAGIAVDRLGVAVDRALGEPAAAEPATPVEVFGASAGAALYRRSMLDAIGGFDESFFAFLEDVDVAWRARMAGWRALYCPAAVVYHAHSATAVHGSSRKNYLVGRNRVRLLAKNATLGQLARYGLLMAAYDAAHVAHSALRDRSLAALRGRLRGLAEWRRYRRLGAATRRGTDLAAPFGIARALARHRVWERAHAEMPAVPGR